MLSNNVDLIKESCETHAYITAGTTAAPPVTSIESIWLKVTLAKEQVKLLHALKGVGVGTNSVEKFMLELENDDIMSWGNLNCKWDRANLESNLIDMIMNVKIRGAEKK